VIRSFAHKGLEAFYQTGSKAGIQPHHAAKLRVLLGALDTASSPASLNLPAWRLHPLTGDMAGHWSVWVNGNWRITFTMDASGDARIVNYQDYH
jgi:toxin HigB-1